MEYKIKNSITPEEYNELRNSVGWDSKDENIILKALENSALVKKVTFENKTIGMARAIGDGLYYLIVDVVVHLEYQKKGIGKLLIESIVKDIVDGLNNLEVAKWMAGVPFPYTENDARNFIERAKNNDENVKMLFAIVLKENNKVIGGTEIRNINKKDGTAGGGIWLNEKYQKNGYGTEAFSARNKYCFEILGLRRIENGYFPNNEKSKKMQMKLGYKEEGIRRKKFLCLATNEYVDECVTGLLKEEFIEWSDENV